MLEYLADEIENEIMRIASIRNLKQTKKLPTPNIEDWIVQVLQMSRGLRVKWESDANKFDSDAEKYFAYIVAITRAVPFSRDQLAVMLAASVYAMGLEIGQNYVRTGEVTDDDHIEVNDETPPMDSAPMP